MQSRTWLLSCLAHYADSSPAEKVRMAEIVGDVSNLSEDDESPRHGLGGDEKQLALSEADKAFNAMMCLLEHNRFEESSSPPRGSVGIAVFLTSQTDCRWWSDSPLVRE